MSRIAVKATIVANESVGNNVGNKRTPVCTRVQIGNNEYEFVNTLTEVRELINENRYSIFVNYVRGKDNNAPFKKGHYCASYREAVEHIASHIEEGPYRVDLVIRNKECSRDELAAIAASLDF